MENSLFKTISTILDDDFWARLDALASQVGNSAWMAGDLVVDMANYLAAHGISATMSDICAYISDYLGGEYAPGTLRIYAAVAQFFPPSVRARYPSSMPFSIFRFAAGQGDKWQLVMDWVMAFLDERGRPPSVRELRQKFRADEFTPPPPSEPLYPLRFDEPEAVAIEHHLEHAPSPRIPKSDEVKDRLAAAYELLVRVQGKIYGEQEKQLLAQAIVLVRRLIEIV